MSLSIKWREQLHGLALFPSPGTPIFNTRKKVEVIRVLAKTANLGSESKAKKENLCAAKKERIKLPSFDDKKFHIREFLSHPSGTEAMLNTRALQCFEPLSSETYRCTLPKLKLLNFEAAPVVDLRVKPTNEDCMVETLSCMFEGSETVERQNIHFLALMTNHMSWGTDDSDESFLEVDVNLKLTLEIHTHPFTMMPVSAVERPGNLKVLSLYMHCSIYNGNSHSPLKLWNCDYIAE